MGQFNKAKLINFVPKLATEDVNVPDSVSLVVANSLTPAAKILTLGKHYNKRVVECRFGVAILALRAGIHSDFLETKVSTFQQLQEAMKESHEGMIKFVNDALKTGGYTPAQIE